MAEIVGYFSSCPKINVLPIFADSSLTRPVWDWGLMGSRGRKPHYAHGGTNIFAVAWVTTSYLDCSFFVREPARMVYHIFLPAWMAY